MDELAHPQQTSRKMHEETWAGLLTKQGLRISQGGGNHSWVCCFSGLSLMS